MLTAVLGAHSPELVSSCAYRSVLLCAYRPVQAAFTTLEMLDALKDNVIFDDDGMRGTPAYVASARRGQCVVFVASTLL